MRVSEEEEARLLPMRQQSAARYIEGNREMFEDLIKKVGRNHSKRESLITPQLKTESQPKLRAMFRQLKKHIEEDTLLYYIDGKE